MEPNVIIQSADHLADGGYFSEAQEALRQLSPLESIEMEALPVRIKICTGLQQWDLGMVLAQRITPLDSLPSRAAVGRMLLSYLKHGEAEMTAGKIMERVRMLCPEWEGLHSGENSALPSAQNS